MSSTIVLKNNSPEDDTELLALEQLLCHYDYDDNNKLDNPSKQQKNNRKSDERQIALEKSRQNYYMDSSDEENVSTSSATYNEYGRSIYKKLKQLEEVETELKAEKNIAQMYDEAGVSLDKPPNYESKSFNNKSTRFSNKKSTFVVNAETNVKSFSNSISVDTKESKNENVSNSLVYSDPVFGLRIINPLISSTILSERMVGRKNVSLSCIASHIQRGDLSKDWVIGGVIVKKSAIQMSKNNKPYIIWSISDLKDDIKMVSLFLFNSAYKELWKISVGTCVAVLKPNVFEKKTDYKSLACLSVDHVSKVMILGKSKDMGFCKARKRDGEICNAIVNLTDCDTCIYHLKQVFSEMSRRSELQSPTAGRGLNELRNKVLGKSEVFYGGRSYSAVPATKNFKHIKKDTQRLSTLSNNVVAAFGNSKINFSKKLKGNGTIPYEASKGLVSKKTENLSVTGKQRIKDLQILKALKNSSDLLEIIKTNSIISSPVVQEMKSNSASLLLSKPVDTGRLKALKKPSESLEITKTNSLPSSVAPDLKSISDTSLLTKGISSERLQGLSGSLNKSSESLEITQISSSPSYFAIQDVKSSRVSSLLVKPINEEPIKLSRSSFFLEIPPNERKAQLAKIKALEVLKRKPIEKSNPNSMRGTNEGKRKAIDDLNEYFTSTEIKRKKLENDLHESQRISRIQRIMAATSSHKDLIELCERREEDKYFNKLEKKEALEEKMLNTYKIPCKAVICKVCNYTAFSAADRCKKESHTIKIIEATKRFFQCKDCGNRTITVFRLPKISCKNCQSSNWERSPMIREKKVVSNTLSIRGDEETFIGNISGKTNLDLIVPEY